MTMMMKKQQDVRKARQSVRLLIAKPEFQREVLKLQRKWGLDDQNANKEKNQHRLKADVLWRPRWKGIEIDAIRGNKSDTKDLKTVKTFYADLVELMKRFHLDSQYWTMTLWEYVRAGKFDEETLQFNLEQLDVVPKVRFEVQPKTGKKKIVLELGDHTTLKDVKAAWHEVEWWRKIWLPKKQKFKEWKNFERDSKVYFLYEHGLTIAEISSKILEEYKVDLDYGNIKKIVSTYRKKIGLPKGDKLITYLKRE